MPYVKLNLEHAEEWERLYVQEGMTLRQIGDQFNWSENTVRNRLLERGVKMRPKYQGMSMRKRPSVVGPLIPKMIELYNEPNYYSVQEIAVELTFHESTVRQALRKAGVQFRSLEYKKRISYDEAQKVRELYESGMDLRQVGAVFDRSACWARNRLEFADGKVRPRAKEFCPKGHKMDAKNTSTNRHGHHGCKRCAADRQAVKYRQAKAKLQEVQ